LAGDVDCVGGGDGLGLEGWEGLVGGLGGGGERRGVEGRWRKGEKWWRKKIGGAGLLVRVASANLAGSIDEGIVNRALCCQ